MLFNSECIHKSISAKCFGRERNLAERLRKNFFSLASPKKNLKHDDFAPSFSFSNRPHRNTKFISHYQKNCSGRYHFLKFFSKARACVFQFLLHSRSSRQSLIVHLYQYLRKRGSVEIFAITSATTNAKR